MRISKTIISLLIITFFVLAGHFYLFKPGIFTSQDGEKLIVRFASFHQALRDGQIPPRWAGNLFHGFGYPVLIFLYPGLLMFWEIIRLTTGMSLILSVKTGLLLSLIFSGFGMYFFLREFFDQSESIIAASIYPLMPYVFFDLYLRGSFGEISAFALIPFIFLAITKYFQKHNFKWIFMGSLFWSALLLIHNVMGILFSGLLLLFIAGLLIRSEKRNYLILLMPVFAVFLGSFFLLPAFWERAYTVFYQTPVADPSGYFLNFDNNFLLDPYHYGVLYLLALVGGGTSFVLRKKNKNPTFFFFAVSLLSLFFSLKISENVWELLPLATYVQFPYRFLSLVTFSTPFLLASFLNLLKNKYLSIFILGLFFLTSTFFYRPGKNTIRTDDYYLTNLDPTTSANEYLPKSVKNIPGKMPKNKIELEGSYRILKQKSNLLEAEIESRNSQIVTVNTFYYPGWKLTINNEIKPIIVDNETGLINFSSDKNKSRVILSFEKTKLRIISEIITLVSFLALILLYV